MIKNIAVFKEFKKQDLESLDTESWYKKADALYEIAMEINPKMIKEGGAEHLEMLFKVRSKISKIKTN